MNIHLNSFEKDHLSNVVGNLQSQFNVSSTTMAPASAVVGIYDALLEALDVMEIDEGTSCYIKTMVRDCGTDDRSLEECVVDLQRQIRDSESGSYSADFALRCLLAVLRDGRLSYPDDHRSIFTGVFRIGELSKRKRFDWEEEKLQPVARHLGGIVRYYHSRNQSFIPSNN